MFSVLVYECDPDIVNRQFGKFRYKLVYFAMLIASGMSSTTRSFL